MRLLALLTLVLTLTGAAPAASFNVNSTGSETDAAPGDGICATSGGACTLRAAVQETNALAGADTINVPAGSYTTPTLTVTDSLTLTGSGSDTTPVLASGCNGIDLAASGTTISITGFSIIGQPQSLFECIQVRVSSGVTALLSDVALTDNPLGHAIANSGILTLSHCLVRGNSGSFFFRDGAGISNSGTLAINDSVFLDNFAGCGHQCGNGGAIYNSGTATIQRSLFRNNETRFWSLAGAGGAIFNATSGSMTISQSLFHGNYAAGSGSAIYNAGQLTLSNSTVSQNISGSGAAPAGGALWNASSGTLTLTHDTVIDNWNRYAGQAGALVNETGGTVQVKNTIIANLQFPNRQTGNCSGTILSNGYNLDSGDTCGLAALGDRSNLDPGLGPLADNGGPTQTHALLTGSLALDSADTAGSPPADQRGAARPQGARPDIGAYEGVVIGSASVGPHSANPFVFSPNGDGIKDSTTLSFTLIQSDQVRVEILEPGGFPVKTLVDGVNLPAGSHAFAWAGDGKGPFEFTINSFRYPSLALISDGLYTYRIRGNRIGTITGRLGMNRSIPEVSRSWYFAEGSTVGFDSYILIQNPNNAAATVTVTFFLQDGTTPVYSEVISARPRATVPIHREVPNTFSVSSRVESDLPVIAERAAYFNFGRAGHDSIGSTTLSREWYFPSNHSPPSREDFLLVTNPTSTPQVYGVAITGDVNFLFVNPTAPSNSRHTTALHALFGNQPYSVKVSSTEPLAAERALYVNSRRGGAAGTGAAAESLTWYFAEGDTTSATTPDGGFQVTILDLFQSNGTVGYSDGLVTVNYLLEGGTTVTREYTLVRPGTSDSRAGRRRSINVADEIGNGQRFAIEILSPRPISAARLSYSGQEVADTIGSPTPDYVWNLAEGFTAFGFETWLAIFNPGSQTANLTVQFQLQNGTQTAYNYSVGARRRQTIYVNSLVPATSFSTQVVSDQPVVVERTMKFAAREGMHQSMGVRQ